MFFLFEMSANKPVTSTPILFVIGDPKAVPFASAFATYLFKRLRPTATVLAPQTLRLSFVRV